ncbi:MAG: hypothetical protein A2X56_14915 [Nitrospirae bacterium GWC2_57_13]|jgi:F0F1-type ATP synthase assembly protein I|nr:MAG: hypothetical protein A2072_02940 [Nitrospirae bacterium GWC1_57_7]OGW28883.1 MAG: hypothetical protein A2X56_14915 [Nitrospirae bacterium GWC2_57_13]OGW42797.1 MAG: hypothetical protein A2X57_09525 [Nitrospirae bacterium GWD2_57_8]HAR45258.1 hypothetical protein [Nitrospiraceae bacterium]HAS54340.1 hypothetical protein [Nitrospiraceae bacterium]
MEMLGLVFMLIGAVIAIVYGIILLVKAFQTSVLWGLGSIFVPFVSLLFVILHWDVAKKPFLMGLISIPFFVIGILFMPDSMMQQVPVSS